MTQDEKIHIAKLLRVGATEMIQQEEYRWDRGANTMCSWEEWRSEYNKSLYNDMVKAADALDGGETWIDD